MEEYQSNELKNSSWNAFRAILLSAKAIRAAGNSFNGTSESNLLREILDDAASGRNLLSQPSQDLALKLLCSDFQRPMSFRDDIFGSDTSAAAHSVAIWKSCRNSIAGDQYL